MKILLLLTFNFIEIAFSQFWNINGTLESCGGSATISNFEITSCVPHFGTCLLQPKDYVSVFAKFVPKITTETTTKITAIITIRIGEDSEVMKYPALCGPGFSTASPCPIQKDKEAIVLFGFLVPNEKKKKRGRLTVKIQIDEKEALCGIKDFIVKPLNKPLGLFNKGRSN